MRLKTILNVWSRKLHRWGAIASMAPLLVVICTGLLLLLKKEIAWIQPTQSVGAGLPPSISFEAVLDASRTIPEAQISSWSDIDRLDVRIKPGIVKVHARNHWEIQVCATTSKVLSSSYRRSDLIESLHDGSWFHPAAKLWIFLPSGIILLGLWFTGVYLWIMPILARRKKR